MADVEVAEAEVQTSLPSVERPSPFHTTQTSTEYSYKSDLSSDSFSVAKLDSLFLNSMKIMTNRSNSVADEQPRRSSILEKVSSMSRGEHCVVEGCDGTVNKYQVPQNIQTRAFHGGVPNLQKEHSLEIAGHRGHPIIIEGLVGVSVEQKRPYRPLTKSSSRPAPFHRSRTTILPSCSGSRHCDACSVKDLQSWFKMNPATPQINASVLNPVLLGREKSQVFLLNKQPRKDVIGTNMEEVWLPTATVPKKGLIKLTSKNEDHVTDKKQFRTGSGDIRRGRREPLRQLIKNKEILRGIRESYNILLEKERLEAEHAKYLLNKGSSKQS